MADRLTQLQDAIDALANQFVASMYYVHKHHELKTLSPTDKVREENKADGEQPRVEPTDVEPHPADVFQAGQVELARDLIVKEQQIEYLISVLPGLANSEEEQEETIKQLEEALKLAEEKRKAAAKDQEEVLARLENVIRSVKRP